MIACTYVPGGAYCKVYINRHGIQEGFNGVYHWP